MRLLSVMYSIIMVPNVRSVVVVRIPRLGEEKIGEAKQKKPQDKKIDFPLSIRPSPHAWACLFFPLKMCLLPKRRSSYFKNKISEYVRYDIRYDITDTEVIYLSR